MSQDQSPTSKATDQKSGQGQGHDSTPVGTSADVSAGMSTPKQQSRIDEPIDALRAGMTNNQTVTKTDTPEQSGTMNNKSDQKTDTKQTSAAKIPTAASPSASSPSASGASTSSSSTAGSINMGSTSTGSTSTSSSTKPPKKANGIWTALILGLVLIAVALGAGLWWQQQRFESVAREIATRLQQSDQQTAQASERASQALTLATAQREVVDQLRRELAVTTNELTTLQQAWEAANEGLDQTLLLNDLKRLITMANQELVLFGNVNSAVSILSSVDSMLKTQSAPALKNLQQAVITDLARLRAVPQVDVASLSARLDSLIQLTGKAPLLAPAGLTSTGGITSQSSPSAAGAQPNATQIAESSTESANSPAGPAAGDPASEQSWWSALPALPSWNETTDKVSQWASDASSVVLREFAEVMSIRKADDPEALLLSEEQAIQLKANVRAMLLSAQLALMTRQTEIWRSELTEVQSLLNTRYDNQALDTKASLNLLNELLEAPVAADVPQLTETLSALVSAERTLSIPIEATEASQASEASEATSTADTTDTGSTTDATTQQGSGATDEATATSATAAPTTAPTTSKPADSADANPNRTEADSANKAGNPNNANSATGQGG